MDVKKIRPISVGISKEKTGLLNVTHLWSYYMFIGIYFPFRYSLIQNA